MKNVLILSGSPRKGGNSDLLCSEFMRGAQESGNEVQKIFVRSKKIAPCSACYYCRDHGGKCALNDDMSEILDAMQAADVIVMASPVYFFSIDAQMKIIIDRSLARWTNIPNKEFYFIMTCADDDRAAMACTVPGVSPSRMSHREVFRYRLMQIRPMNTVQSPIRQTNRLE